MDEITRRKKELKHLYQTSAKEIVQVDVPTMHYMMKKESSLGLRY
jgi:hypothetical protein